MNMRKNRKKYSSFPNVEAITCLNQIVRFFNDLYALTSFSLFLSHVELNLKGGKIWDIIPMDSLFIFKSGKIWEENYAIVKHIDLKFPFYSTLFPKSLHFSCFYPKITTLLPFYSTYLPNHSTVIPIKFHFISQLTTLYFPKTSTIHPN